MQESSQGWKDLADLQARQVPLYSGEIRQARTTANDITECGTNSDVNIHDSPNPKRTHLPPGAWQVTEMCGTGTVAGKVASGCPNEGAILE